MGSCNWCGAETRGNIAYCSQKCRTRHQNEDPDDYEKKKASRFWYAAIVIGLIIFFYLRDGGNDKPEKIDSNVSLTENDYEDEASNRQNLNNSTQEHLQQDNIQTNNSETESNNLSQTSVNELPPNVIRGSDGKLRPSEGYRWANSDPNDYSVVKKVNHNDIDNDLSSDGSNDVKNLETIINELEPGEIPTIIKDPQNSNEIWVFYKNGKVYYREASWNDKNLDKKYDLARELIREGKRTRKISRKSDLSSEEIEALRNRMSNISNILMGN